jgi:GTPase SAR1 family protein
MCSRGYRVTNGRQDSASTIGVEFDPLILNIDYRKLKVQIWDTVG